jgi:hypothetical protein
MQTWQELAIIALGASAVGFVAWRVFNGTPASAAELTSGDNLALTLPGYDAATEAAIEALGTPVAVTVQDALAIAPATSNSVAPPPPVSSYVPPKVAPTLQVLPGPKVFSPAVTQKVTGMTTVTTPSSVSMLSDMLGAQSPPAFC